MPCRLCLEDKPLQQSHIIPELIYRPMYNEKHQIFALDGSKKVRIHQKGARERLLCWDCEQQIGRYEKYAGRILFGESLKISEEHRSMIVLRGLRYDYLKLFFLSIIWRFGVTSIAELQGARLDHHEEKLRIHLVNADPGNYLSYPCAIVEVSLNGQLLREWIIPPRASRVHSHRLWNVVLGSFLLMFYVSAHPAPESVRPMFLKPDGTMAIYRSDIRNIPSLYDIARRVSALDF